MAYFFSKEVVKNSITRNERDLQAFTYKVECYQTNSVINVIPRMLQKGRRHTKQLKCIGDVCKYSQVLNPRRGGVGG